MPVVRCCYEMAQDISGSRESLMSRMLTGRQSKSELEFLLYTGFLLASAVHVTRRTYAFVSRKYGEFLNKDPRILDVVDWH